MDLEGGPGPFDHLLPLESRAKIVGSTIQDLLTQQFNLDLLRQMNGFTWEDRHPEGHTFAERANKLNEALAAIERRYPDECAILAKTGGN